MIPKKTYQEAELLHDICNYYREYQNGKGIMFYKDTEKNIVIITDERGRTLAELHKVYDDDFNFLEDKEDKYFNMNPWYNIEDDDDEYNIERIIYR